MATKKKASRKKMGKTPKVRKAAKAKALKAAKAAKAPKKPKAPKAKAKALKAPKVPMRPLGDRILVKRLEPADIVKGGIIIPDSAKEKPQEGIVVALGEGRKTKNGKVLPFDVKVGDRVMIEKYTGSDIMLDDEEYTIIKEDGVLAILD